MANHDFIKSPAHYTVYPVQPIEITRHLGFCLGNAVKYVLRAPYKGGVEDCLKARQYLAWDEQTPMLPSVMAAYCLRDIRDLREFLEKTPGDQLWKDIAEWQAKFLLSLGEYLQVYPGDEYFSRVACSKRAMICCVGELRRVLELRDTTGQIYEGMTGLPEVPDTEGE